MDRTRPAERGEDIERALLTELGELKRLAAGRDGDLEALSARAEVEKVEGQLFRLRGC